MKEQPVILFDGVCNFCNGAVNFVLKRDQTASIRFGALQTEPGQEFLRQHQFSTTEFNSFVFIEDGKAYTRSTAALKVSRYLSGLWPLFYGFIIVPKFLRDALYDLVARNRYKWFGRKDACMIPGPDIRERFI